MIEVSDLKGKDSSGTSDPIVHASCLGTTKHTRVRKGVNSAVFDEVLYFNLPNLSRCGDSTRRAHACIRPVLFAVAEAGGIQPRANRACAERLALVLVLPKQLPTDHCPSCGI